MGWDLGVAVGAYAGEVGIGHGHARPRYGVLSRRGDGGADQKRATQDGRDTALRSALAKAAARVPVTCSANHKDSAD
ncbi:MAG: hypothetical protein NVS3B12_09290 [Acidimicrobiales bacterium]